MVATGICIVPADASFPAVATKIAAVIVPSMPSQLVSVNDVSGLSGICAVAVW